MTKARDIMTEDVEFARRSDSVQAVARRMASLDVGLMPVFNDDRRIDGVITDRDLGLHVVCEGRDPSCTTVNDVRSTFEVETIGPHDSVEEAMETMRRHAVRHGLGT